MHILLTARCQWTRANNGITQALLTCAPSDRAPQEQNILVNVLLSFGHFETGEHYLVEIKKTGPPGI